MKRACRAFAVADNPQRQIDFIQAFIAVSKSDVITEWVEIVFHGPD
ncbi:MAG: hypothetical protein ACREQV_05400 [Candidatus Binatia bacterium]